MRRPRPRARRQRNTGENVRVLSGSFGYEEEPLCRAVRTEAKVHRSTWRSSFDGDAVMRIGQGGDEITCAGNGADAVALYRHTENCCAAFRWTACSC
jgi:hypothetical protein